MQKSGVIDLDASDESEIEEVSSDETSDGH